MSVVRFCRRYGFLLLLLAAAVALPWVYGDARTRLLGLNTLLLAGAVAAISLTVGAPLAFLLVRSDMAGRAVAGWLLGTLLFIPLYLQAAAWQAGFGVRGWFTVATDLPPLVDVWMGAIWVDAAAAVPWVVLIVGLGLWLVEPELEEEALLNASAPKVFFRVTCRRALGALGAAALWAALTAAGDITATSIFQIRTYAEETYSQAALGDEPEFFSWQHVSSGLIVAWLVAAGLVLAVQLAPQGRQLSQRGPWRFRLGPWRWPLTLAAWAVVLLLVGVPVGSLIYKAGASITRDGDGWLYDWTVQKCVAVVLASPQRFQAEFGWSLLIGSLAAIGAVIAALPLAWIARRGGVWAAPACAVTAVCLALPGPTVGVLLIQLFQQSDAELVRYLYDRSIVPPLLAQVIRILPLAILILWHALATVPRECLEMAATEGAGRFTVFYRIGLASRRTALFVALLVCLAAALGETSASILVVPPGVNTLAIEIFALIHYGVDDFVAGICLALSGFLACLAAGVFWLVLRREP